MPNGIKLHSDQWALGDLRRALQAAPKNARVTDGNRRHSMPCGFCSYRGFYDDACLLVGPVITGHHTVGELLEKLDAFFDEKTMHGYKGGTYPVRTDTPLWIDSYGGASGRYVVGLRVNAAGTLARVLSKQEEPDNA